MLDDPQVQHLQSFATLKHPTEGEIVTPRRPVLIDGEREDPALAPPTLGEHTGAVLQELGYDEPAIAKLRADKVI